MQKVQNTGLCVNDMDTTVRPGDDFFRYASGHWQDNNPALPEYPHWGTFTMVQDRTTMQISELIRSVAEEEHHDSSEARMIADLYAIYMDTDRLEREGCAPIMPYLQEIDACGCNQELVDLMVARHDDLLFVPGIGVDPKDSTRNIMFFIQGVGNPDTYLSEDPNHVRIVKLSHEHHVNLLKLTGETEESATRMADLYDQVKRELAEHCMTLVEQRDPEATYHMMTIDEMQAMTPAFDWKRYLNNYGYDATVEANFTCPKAIVKACQMYMELPLEALKTMYKIVVVRNASARLSEAFRQENHDFSVKVYGPSEEPERWKSAVRFVKNVMGDVVTRVYVEKYFPERNKTRALAMVERLREAFAERILAQEWMSEPTRQAALDKLAAMSVKIGYPDRWEEVPGLSVDTKLSLWDNCQNLARTFWNYNKEKNYNKPVDKSEWWCPATRVNAFYSSVENSITFPAAILQSPFFDVDADEAVNLGSIGVIIGHEMTHGFDDKGCMFDKDGNLKQWWSPEDAERYKALTQRMADFHDTLEPLPGLHCNGRLTLGEDIADRGGISIALQALKKLCAEQPQPVLDGMSAMQRFFLAFARNWAGSVPDEQIRLQTLNGVHSIPQIRVNAAVVHFDEWYEAFGVEREDALFREREDRLEIW